MSPFSISTLPGTASIAATAIAAAAAILIAGLRSMSQPQLNFPERRLIGRYMLGGVALLLVIGVVLLFLHNVGSSAPGTALDTQAAEIRASLSVSQIQDIN